MLKGTAKRLANIINRLLHVWLIREKLDRVLAGLSITLIAIILVSAFAAIELINKTSLKPNFYVGVEFAYGNNENDLKALVNKVKDYTNLFVIGSPDITLNQTKLNEICDYIYDAGLSFIVLFGSPTTYTMFNATYGQPYHLFVWIDKAKQKYGDKFLASYYFDEPGGNQMDNGSSRQVLAAEDYTSAANDYME